MVQGLSLLHNFIQQSLNSRSADLRRLKYCLPPVVDLQCLESLTMVRLKIRLNAFRRSNIPQKKKKINKTTSIHHFRLKYILPALLKPFELIKTSETKNKFYTQLKNEKWPNMLQKTFGMNKARSLQHN